MTRADEVLRTDPVYGSVIFKMPAEVEAAAERVLSRQPSGGIITIKSEPVLACLIPTQSYEGKDWTATRRQIDQLDQVTFGRKAFGRTKKKGG